VLNEKCGIQMKEKEPDIIRKGLLDFLIKENNKE